MMAQVWYVKIKRMGLMNRINLIILKKEEILNKPVFVINCFFLFYKAWIVLYKIFHSSAMEESYVVP